MKKLTWLFLFVWASLSTYADYTIHAPCGIYVSVVLKHPADQYGTLFVYGANIGETEPADQWNMIVPNGWPGVFVCFGKTIVIVGDWVPGWNGAWQQPLLNVWAGGPPPDFYGDGNGIIGAVGEYWIDFAPDGSARVLTSMPTDFGKWFWDGSINPCWVEPLVGKRLAKGHQK